MTRPRDDDRDALLAEYIDGKLDEASRRRVEAALDAEPALKRQIAAMMADARCLRDLPSEGVEYDLSEGFEVQAEREMLLGDVPGPTPAVRRFRLPPAAIAAMLLLGVGLVWVSIEVMSADPTSSVPLAATTASPASPEAMPSPQASSPIAARSETLFDATLDVERGADPSHDLFSAPLPEREWLAIERLRAGDSTRRPVVAAVIETTSPVASRMLVGSYLIDAGVLARVIPAPHPMAQTLQMLDQMGHPTQAGRMISQIDELKRPTLDASEPLGLMIPGIDASRFGDLLTGLTQQASPPDLRRQVVIQSLTTPARTIEPQTQIDGVVIIRQAMP